MVRIGPRTVLAATCLGCGHLFEGRSFGRHVRKHGERAYIDRRCTDCKWGTRAKRKQAPEDK